MSGPPPRLPLLKAVQAVLADVTGKPCGLGAAPKLNTVPVAPPYTILYALPGGGIEALTMSGEWDEIDAMVQVTHVSAKDDREALWLQDRVRTGMLARNDDGSYVHAIEIEGFKVTRRFDEDAGRDGEGAIVSLVDRYALNVTPT